MGYTRQSRSDLSFACMVESVAIPKIIPKTEKNSRQLWIKETRRFCKYTKLKSGRTIYIAKFKMFLEIGFVRS